MKHWIPVIAKSDGLMRNAQVIVNTGTGFYRLMITYHVMPFLIHVSVCLHARFFLSSVFLPACLYVCLSEAVGRCEIWAWTFGLTLS